MKPLHGIGTGGIGGIRARLRSLGKGMRLGLPILAVLMLAAAGAAAARPTGSGPPADGHPDPASAVFAGGIEDRPVESVTQESAEQERAPAPSFDASLKDAVKQAIGAYEGQVSVGYVPLSASPDTIPSELNAQRAGEAFGIEATRRMTAASMIKLAVLAELLDEVAEGNRSLDDRMVVSAGDIVGGSGVVQSMGPGTVLSLEDAARYMIAESDNVATNMIIDLLGMDAVNARAAQLGLDETALHRTMLDETAASQGRENYTSARDVATLLCSVAQGGFVDASMSGVALGFLEQQSDREGVVDGVPPGVAVAHKTGTLDGIEHDGAIVLAGKPYVLVVMTEGIGHARAKELIATVSRIVYEHAEAAG